MHAFTRRGILYLFALALAACSSGAGSTISPPATGFDSTRSSQSSLDDVLDSAPEVTGGHAVFHPLSIHPNAKGPAILINFVANGPNQGGVPCIACVAGASSSDTVGLTGPSSYVPNGAVWQYELSYTDISYKGKCASSRLGDHLGKENNRQLLGDAELDERGRIRSLRARS